MKAALSSEDAYIGFSQLQEREDLANLLKVDDKTLRYVLYAMSESKKYRKFKIPKKGTGKFRDVVEPHPQLKYIQAALNHILQAVYQKHINKVSAHGFIKGRSIITNAKNHVAQKCVLNIDLKDFFPSINFGRVYGLLKAKPYNCSESIATVIAQICCYENQLPQGAPTSPVISNMICAKLDTEFQRFSKRYRCFYTRYADDITFSSFKRILPQQVASFTDVPGKINLGSDLIDLIERNGFKINEEKSRLRTHNRRQEVTGLIVNEKVNVKREYINTVRVMLFKLEKDMDEKNQASSKFSDKILGRIEFIGAVRGRNDSIYLKFLSRLDRLSPNTLNEKQKRLVKQDFITLAKPQIWTEGKTDCKHIKIALSALQEKWKYQDLNIELMEDVPDTRQGYKNLLTRLEYAKDRHHQTPNIFVFDRDITDNEIAYVHDENKGFKSWGNGSYSLILPIPEHRRGVKDLCIEHYYTDNELKTKDKNGRRLFISDEFDKRSFRHSLETNISTTSNNVKRGPYYIIDDAVFDATNENIALSKDTFASYILSNTDEFSGFNFDEFSKIFDVIEKIIIFHSNISRK